MSWLHTNLKSITLLFHSWSKVLEFNFHYWLCKYWENVSFHSAPVPNWDGYMVERWMKQINWNVKWTLIIRSYDYVQISEHNFVYQLRQYSMGVSSFCTWIVFVRCVYFVCECLSLSLWACGPITFRKCSTESQWERTRKTVRGYQMWDKVRHCVTRTARNGQVCH